MERQKIGVRTKLKLVQTMVDSIFLYACEIWTLTAELQWRIQVAEMHWLWTILGISYADHVSNNKIQEHLKRGGHYEDLLSTVKRCKLMM